MKLTWNEAANWQMISGERYTPKHVYGQKGRKSLRGGWGLWKSENPSRSACQLGESHITVTRCSRLVNGLLTLHDSTRRRGCIGASSRSSEIRGMLRGMSSSACNMRHGSKGGWCPGNAVRASRADHNNKQQQASAVVSVSFSSFAFIMTLCARNTAMS